MPFVGSVGGGKQGVMGNGKVVNVRLPCQPLSSECKIRGAEEGVGQTICIIYGNKLEGHLERDWHGQFMRLG